MSRISNEQRTLILEWLIFILFVFGYFAWLSINTVYAASANGRLLDRFVVDEYQQFYIVRQALMERTLYIEWSVYGHLYFNLVLLPLLVLQFFTPISDQVIILALRYVAVLSSAMTVVFTFWLARRYFGRTVAWISSVLLMILPFTFNFWSVTIKPDTLQMLTVVGCLFACCEFINTQQKKYLIAASVCAGLSFSTKYAGAFLVPIICLLSVVSFENDRMSISWRLFSFPKLGSSIRFVLVTLLVFVATFIVTSPSLFVDWQFIDGITAQAKYTSVGYIFQTNNDHTEWFEILSSPSLLGLPGSILVVFALMSFLVNGWRTRGREFFSYNGLLWIWVLFYFLFAFFRVNIREDRYMLIIMPFIFILLASFITEIASYFRRKFSRNVIYYLMVGFFVLVGGMEIWGGLTRQVDLIETRLIMENNDPAIQVGLWLEENYLPSTRILYDRYSYIPPQFERVQGSYGIDEQMLLTFNPRVVVINPSIRDVYLDPSLADSFTEGTEKYMAIYDFYRLMESEMLGYKLIKEFGSIKIFERERK